MRSPILPVCALAGLVLSGCAAAMPGYLPDKGRHKLGEMAAKSKADSSGERAADGSYIPTSAERAYTCRRLTGIMQLKIQQVRDSEAHPPSGLITSLTRKSTPQYTASGTPGVAYSEDRARLVALNNLMVEKNCGRFDLDADLRPGTTSTPEPIRPAKGKNRQR